MNTLEDTHHTSFLATLLLPLYAIAANTYREALRNKVLGALVFASLFTIGSGLALSQMSLHEERRVITDFSYWSNSIISMLIAVYASVTLVSTEIKDRTVYTIITKPLSRWLFIVGKFLGVYGIVLTNILVLWVLTSGLLYAMDSPMQSAWLMGPFSIAIQCLLLVSFSLLFSTFSTPLLSGIFTGTLWIIGNLQTQLTTLLDQNYLFGSLSPTFKILQRFLPNYEALNVSLEITHASPIPSGYVFASLWYGVSYAAILVAIACLIFTRRDVE